MIKLEEDTVGCQLYYAYSTEKVFVWPYLLLRLLRKAGWHSPLGMQSCSMALWPGISQAQFIPARWQVPLQPAVFQFWKEKAENTHVNMVCCLSLAEQYIISLTCAVLVTFISVAECGTHTVLSLLCVKCTLDFTDSLKRNYRWCCMVPLRVSTNIFK